MSRNRSYWLVAVTLLLAATPGLGACGDDDGQNTPRARTGSATPASTETGDPSRRGPAIAELNLAARDAFVACAQQRDELGLIVGFRDGQAVSETGDGADGEFDTRVAAPRAIAAILEDGGQYVGLREGEGPDLDIILLLSETQEGESEPSASSMIEEEVDAAAVVGASFGDTARGHFQMFLTVSNATPTSRKRTQEREARGYLRDDELNSCLDRAARAVE